MKKIIAIFLAAVIAAASFSCKDLKRNNPYDPDSTDYGGITYKEQVWYPDNAAISGMIISGGQLVFGGYNPTDGDCVMKMTGASAYYPVGSTGDTAGSFRYITDICADDSGNIYAVDNKYMVQTISPSNVMGSWPISPGGIDNLSIECLNNNIFISNYLDKTVTKYSTAGVYADTLSLSFTSYGEFIPGRLIKGPNYLYVVNALDKSEIVRLNDALVNTGEFDFEDEIMDGVVCGTQMQFLATQAVYKTDPGMVVALKWGNFGVGPGRVLNGKLITYNAAADLVYVLDGLTIKKFGE